MRHHRSWANFTSASTRRREFIEAQPIFFVATAPLAAEGTVNLSPKGLRGSFAVLDEIPWPTLTSQEATPKRWHTYGKTVGSP